MVIIKSQAVVGTRYWRVMNLENHADVVGIGFGPANIALSLAFADRRRAGLWAPKALFFEKSASFMWHPGLLIDGATMQISFLKDLVTQRDPTSPYSFLCYLKEAGRLPAFINLRDFYPTRREFSDYLRWCSEKSEDQVLYSQKVCRVSLGERSNGSIKTLIVTTLDGEGHEHRTNARSVVFALGLQPQFPQGIKSNSRIWHASELLDRMSNYDASSVQKIIVAGAGQSAAEVVSYLLDNVPRAEIHLLTPGIGLSPADDSPFVNSIFDSDMVDRVHQMSPEMRNYVRKRHANTNYGVVDLDLIVALHRRVYAELVSEQRRLHLRHLSRLLDAREAHDRVLLTVGEPRGEMREEIEADILICATGYQPRSVTQLCDSDVLECFRRSPSGKPEIARDYRIATNGELEPPVFTQSDCEDSHGLSANLLSLLAIRSGEIAEAVAKSLQV